MEYVKIVDGKPYPYTEAAFRLENKPTVYGKVIASSQLNAHGVYKVRTLPEPVEIGKKAVINDTPENVGGEWVLGWTLKPLGAEDARSLRTKLLQETDWMALSDNAMTPEWASYRQALRDITEQAGFPYSMIWPTKP